MDVLCRFWATSACCPAVIWTIAIPFINWQGNFAPGCCQGRETFALFLPWAQEILHFIEQLDLEDVPSESLNHIKEHAEIGFSVPEDINKLLMHLGVLRQAYHQELEAAAIGPAGVSISSGRPPGEWM